LLPFVTHQDIYGVLAKWAQKKESYAAFSTALMVTMTTLACSDFIDEYGESLITRLTTHANKKDRERDREGKEPEASADERKTPRNRERQRSLSVDKGRKDAISPNSLTGSAAAGATSPSSSAQLSCSSSSSSSSSASSLHYLSLLLTYLQTLNDAYVRAGNESYSRQMQTAIQFLFSCNGLQGMSSDQYQLLESIAYVIVRLPTFRRVIAMDASFFID
jgi:hypothetical protein